MWQIGMTVVVRSYSTVLGLGTVADVRDGCPVLTADRQVWSVLARALGAYGKEGSR